MKTNKLSKNTVSLSPSKAPKRLGLQLAIAGILLSGYGGRKAYAGSCSGGPNTFVCSGAANNMTDVQQNFAGNSLEISTLAGFGIDTSVSGGRSISIIGTSGTGNIIFTDLNNSIITGAVNGIEVSGAYSIGYISLTTTGPVSGISRDGILFDGIYYAPNVGDVIINAQDTVSGGADGIELNNYGGGASNITTVSNVSGGNGAGIKVLNEYNSATDIIINSQALVSGNSNGISAVNNGTGVVTISANDVTSTTNAAIKVDANTDVTGVTITAQGTISGRGGIFSSNNGTGNQSITTNSITGNANQGITAINYNNAGSLEINTQGTVSADNHGIYAVNLGTGVVNITTNEISSTNEQAMEVINFNGSHVTISAIGPVSGSGGISSDNLGAGNLSITANSTVSGDDRDGINAFNYFNSGSIDIVAQGAVSGRRGIAANSFGNGDITINSSDTVTGATDHGIAANNQATAASISVEASGDVVAEVIGVHVSNSGTSTDITTHASVTSNTSHGISATQEATSTGDLEITASGSIQGANTGIKAEALSASNISISVSGLVQGGLGRGIDASTLPGQTATINLQYGATLTQGLYNNGGHSLTTVATGASISGDISLNDGSDQFIINNSDFSGVTLLDGGDDSETADGFFDVLKFNGAAGAMTASQVNNWEYIIIDQGSVIAIDGSDSLNSGELLLINNSVMSLQDNATDDALTINANFSGGGIINLDTSLSDSSSPTDSLTINGDTFGNTTININNLGGLGANTTGDGILLIDVHGSSNGTFNLPAPLNVNGFEYTLVKVGGDWYLQGAANDADVSIIKNLISPGPFVVGDTVTYLMDIKNDGPLDASNVIVSDTMTNLTLVSISGGTCAPASFPCTIASLPSGSSETLAVTATIDVAGAFDNAASVSADQPDTNMANNMDNTGNGGQTLPQFQVGVTVTGLTANNGVELLNNGGDNLMVNSNHILNNFSMPLNDGDDYDVSITAQPTMPNQTCNFTGANSGTINGSDVTDIEIHCVIDSYFIGGTVNGLFPGNYLVLENNNGDDEVVMSNGAFAFSNPIEDEQGYDVTIDLQPDDPIQPCAVVNGDGSVMGADITDVVVTCEFGDDMIFRDGFEVLPPPAILDK